MRRYYKQEKRFNFKETYIFTLIILFFSAFLFINLTNAADTDQVAILIPKIEGVNFYRSYSDGSQAEIKTSSSTKNISFLKTETLNLKVKADNEQYFSGLDEEDRESAKAAFSVVGALSLAEPTFDGEYWNLSITSLDDENIKEQNALNLNLKSRADVFLEFRDADSVTFFSADGSENLGGTLKRVVEGKSFEFTVKMDITGVNISDPNDFKISVGNNEYTMTNYTQSSNIYTYSMRIDKVIESANVEVSELATIEFTEIQGLEYYEDANFSRRIQNNSAKIFAIGSQYTFYLKIDSKVPLKSETEALNFYFGSNEVTQEYMGGRKYKITLTNIKINSGISSSELYKIWFPASDTGATYTDSFGTISNTYRSVGAGADYTFSAKLTSVFDGVEGVEFSAGSNIEIETTKKSSTSYEITLKEVNIEGEVTLNYSVVGFNSYEGVKYYESQNKEISAGSSFAVMNKDNFVFYIGFDTTQIEVGDNIREISVSAGENTSVSTSTANFSTDSEKVFKVTIKNITSSFKVEIPGYLTLNLNHNFYNMLDFFEADPYLGIHTTQINGAGLTKKIVNGSEYSFVARLKKADIMENDSNTGTAGKIRFLLGDDNPVVINKYYVEGEYIYYLLTATMNSSGSISLEDGYTVDFESPENTTLGFSYPNSGKSLIKGYGDCSFTITMDGNSKRDFTPEFLIDGQEVETSKLQVSSKTYTIKNIDKDLTISPVTRSINYMSAESTLSENGYSITSKTPGAVKNSDGSEVLTVAKGLVAEFEIKFDKTKVNIAQDINNITFQCGNNKVEITNRTQSGNNIIFTVYVTCTEDAEFSISKSVLFPDLYNVNFYKCEKNGSSKYALGEQIQNGTRVGFLPGDSFEFFVELDDYIAVNNAGSMFEDSLNGLQLQNVTKDSNGGFKEGKQYYCYKINKVIYTSSITSNYIFTVDLAVLPGVYYYTQRDNSIGEFSGQLLDNKFTISKDNKGYKFYVHFEGVSKGKITASSGLSISQDNSGVDYTIVTVNSISAESSIEIQQTATEVSVEMPTLNNSMQYLMYSVEGSEYKEGDGYVVDVNYGDEVKIKFSFKRDAEGYSNLYKTPYNRITVKVYRVLDSSSGSSDRTKRVLLQTLAIRNLSEEADEFIVPNVDYETESFNPDCDVVLEVDGINEDVYDVNLISGDNEFIDVFTNITQVLKIIKIETSESGEDVEVNIPYSNYRGGYLIKAVKYGEELRFKYAFTDGANDEGIKYNLSEITMKIDPYEGDTDEIEADSDNIYAVTIKTDSEITFSGIKGNQYEITIPKTPDVTVRYALNVDQFPDDDLLQTAQDNKILITHGQKIMMKISSNDSVKQYIGKVTALNTMYEGSQEEILYDALADKKEVEATIQAVLGHTNLIIEVSKLEYEMQIVLRERDTDNNESYFYPDVEKLYIYDNSTSTTINNSIDTSLGYASFIVTEGSNFEFRISLDYKYNRSDIIVSYIPLTATSSGASSIITPSGGDLYTINRVSQSYKVIIDGIKMNTYEVTFPQPSEEVNFHRVTISADGQEVTDPLALNGAVVVTHGESLMFKPVINAGYSLAGESVKANDEPIRLQNGKYQLNNISEDINITVDPLDKIEYTITFPTTIEGVSFTDPYGSALTSSKKKFGESINFKVAIDSKYNQIADSIKVYAVASDVDWSNPDYNPTVDSGAINLLKDAASNYNLTSISRDSTIIVTGITANKYFIDLPLSEEGITFQIPTKNQYGETVWKDVTEENESELSLAPHGENFIFSVLAKEGYDISQINITAIVTGSTLESTVEKIADGFILEEVSNAYTIKISNVKKKYHTIAISGDYMEFRTTPTSAETIKSGEAEYGVGKFEFYVTPIEGFVFNDGGLTAYAEPLEGATITLPKLKDDGTLDGPVVVTNVRSDITLKLGGIDPKTIAITLPVETEGITFMSVDNESSGGSSSSFELGAQNIVEINSEFKFHIKAEPGYDISNILVSIGAGEYIYPVDEIYTISGATQNIKVTVENIQYSTYIVKMRGDNLTFYEPNGVFPQSDFTISYKGQTQFRIVPNTGYELDLENDLSFFINNQEITIGGDSAEGVSISKPDVNGVFTVSNVTHDIVINTYGAKKQLYNLNFPTNLTGAVLKTPEGRVLEATEKAEYLSEFKFEIVPNEGYNADSAVITLDPLENGIVKSIDGGYTIQSITGNINVSVSGISPNQYTVSYKGMGANFYNAEGSQLTSDVANFGASFTFSIKATEGFNLLNGYNISLINDKGEKATVSAEVTQASLPEGTTIAESDRFSYTVSDVRGNLIIMVENVGKSEYVIAFPTSIKGINFLNEEGQTITSATVIHGADFVFRITAEEGYNIDNIVVTSNLMAIDLTDGKYTLENITQDISIEVSGVVSTKVFVSLKYVDGVKYTDVNDVELSTLEKISVDYASSYSFKVALEDSYSQSKDKMTVSVSPQSSALTFERGIYTLSNITEDAEVTVLNVEINTYKVNLTAASGVIYKDEFDINEIKGEQIVEYGKDFKFIAQPDEGYDLTDIEVSVKGAQGDRIALTPVDKVYTIPSVTMDYTVVVEKAKKEVYTLEVRLPEGVALVDENGSSMETTQSIKHGDNFSFRLSLQTAYDKSSPVVTVKGSSNPITPENNIYTVKNVTGNTIVEITGVEKNTYKVKFVATEGVIYRTEKNKDFSGYLEVEYGGTLNFKIAMKDEYDASQIMVLLDGDKVLSANGGIYQIVSVNSDCEVSVKYSEKNAEEYVIEMIEELPNNISTREQANQVVSVSKAFNELPEENQALVTNLSKLKILQTQTSDIHHTSEDIEVSGIDWQIKVNVTPLDGDAESVARLNEKMQRKTIISHYEITLVNSLTGEKYEPAEGQKVSVVLPFTMPKGYMNTAIVHEKASGSIEYLDVLISGGYAKFETTSFSVFGVAAKKIPNYVEDTTDVTVSLAGLTESEEESKKFLGEALAALVDETDKQTDAMNATNNNSKNGKIIDDTEGTIFDRALNWLLNHEFLATLILVIIFSIWIFIAVKRSQKKGV